MVKSIEIQRLIDDAFGAGVLSRDGINYAINCPSCKDDRKHKRKLIVRLDDGRYHCWVCGLKGKSVKSLLAKHSSATLENASIRFKKSSSHISDEAVRVSLPKDHVLLSSTDRFDPDLLATKKYLNRRGLSQLDIARWRALTVMTGQYRRRVIIPSFDEVGNLNYFVARAIDSGTYLKYKNPKVSKEDVIFNEIDIDWDVPIVLVEGVFDAIKCPPNTIPLLGSSLSIRSKLYKKLAEHQSMCTVALDPDLKTKAFKLASMLKSSGCDVRIAFAPDGKDFGDMEKKQVKKVLQFAKQYTDIMRISHKISRMKSGSII